MATFDIHHGDALDVLREIPSQSVNCCVTSPPYYGLRDYGVDGQIGLEETPEAYISRLVEVFREVRRVLKDDGTLWVNIGDSYASSTKGSGGSGVASGLNCKRNDDNSFHRDSHASSASAQFAVRKFDLELCGLKPKDLIGIPWMLAFALRADGWYLRSEIIWHKPNPMPESVKDRPTKAHEQIFLLSKSPKYFYDADAVKERALQPLGKPSLVAQHKQTALNANQTGTLGTNYGPSFRNRRSVWTVTPKPYKEAHFATFPPDLIKPCILAGCPEGGTVLDPFGGSGTTAQVAIENRRNAVLIELNPDYIELIEKRLVNVQPKREQRQVSLLEICAENAA